MPTVLPFLLSPSQSFMDVTPGRSWYEPNPNASNNPLDSVVDVVGWHQDATEDTILKTMSKFGHIRRIIRWQGSTEKQHAYIQFEEPAGAQAALRDLWPGRLQISRISPDPTHRERFRAFTEPSRARDRDLGWKTVATTTATRMAPTNLPHRQQALVHRYASFDKERFASHPRVNLSHNLIEHELSRLSGTPNIPQGPSVARNAINTATSTLRKATLLPPNPSEFLNIHEDLSQIPSGLPALIPASKTQGRLSPVSHIPEAPRNHQSVANHSRKSSPQPGLPPTPKSQNSPNSSIVSRLPSLNPSVEIVIGGQNINLSSDQFEDEPMIILLKFAKAHGSVWTSVAREFLKTGMLDSAEKVVLAAIKELDSRNCDPRELKPHLLMMSTIFNERAKPLPAGSQRSEFLEKAAKYISEAMGKHHEDIFEKLRDLGCRLALKVSLTEDIRTGSKEIVPDTSVENALADLKGQVIALETSEHNATFKLQSDRVEKRKLEDELSKERHVRRKLERRVKDLDRETASMHSQLAQARKMHAETIGRYEKDAAAKKKTLGELERTLGSLQKVFEEAKSAP